MRALAQSLANEAQPGNPGMSGFRHRALAFFNDLPESRSDIRLAGRILKRLIMGGIIYQPIELGAAEMATDRAPLKNGLWVTFSNPLGEVDRVHAASGLEAVRVAVMLLVREDELHDGDVLRILRT